MISTSFFVVFMEHFLLTSTSPPPPHSNTSTYPHPNHPMRLALPPPSSTAAHGTLPRQACALFDVSAPRVSSVQASNLALPYAIVAPARAPFCAFPHRLLVSPLPCAAFPVPSPLDSPAAARDTASPSCSAGAR